MPRVPIIMPQLGESIAEATIVNLPFQPGDLVESDQDVIEVETNKATMGVTTPCRGRIAELLVELQQSYPVGATLAWLEVTEEEGLRVGGDASGPVMPDERNGLGATVPSPKAQPADVQPTVRGLPVP